MITEKKLIDGFGQVEKYNGEYYLFRDKMPKYKIEYCLKLSLKYDLLSVVENVENPAFASEIIHQAPGELSFNKPTIYDINVNEYGFTHVISVPSHYHSDFKGRLDAERENLFLCLPIYRCEFSGDEDEHEFKEMCANVVPVLEWPRLPAPKLKVYFDNPRTGGGTDKLGVWLKYSTLIDEIQELNGVGNGFIEITNYKGSVVEVLSPSVDIFLLIRNRSDEETMTFAELKLSLDKFISA